MEAIAVKILREGATLPTYGSTEAAGADLYALTDGEVVFAPGETKFIRTGLAMEIPEGYAGLIYARSGLATKRGLAPANKVGVVDADYRGEVGVILINLGQEDFVVNDGERIAQMVVARYEQAELLSVDVLDETERGEGGFGHSGVK